MYQRIETAEATAPGGHYSQAVVYGGLVYVSGQLGFDPGTTNKSATNVEEEALNCLLNLSAILSESGAAISSVLRTTIYVSDVAHWPVVNAVYAKFMGDHYPARAIVPCNALHHGFQVEIEAIAAVILGDE